MGDAKTEAQLAGEWVSKVYPDLFSKIKKLPQFSKQKALIVFIYGLDFSFKCCFNTFSPGKIKKHNFWDFKIAINFKKQ